MSRAFFVSFFHGVSRSNPWASPTACRTRYQYSRLFDAQGAMAPSLMDRSESGTTSSGSTSRRVPSPSHVGQAPYGELNEKLRGANSSNESPQYVHASFCENVWTSSWPSWVTTATDAIASASSKACSLESATRRRLAGLAT